MKYQNIEKGKFLIRRNRFVAEVEISGRQETVHVKNTGRCRELLLPGSEVFLTRAENPERKTRYDLIAVSKERNKKTPLLINMDSQIPNAAAMEYLQTSGIFSHNAVFKREVTYKNSRFDIFVEDGSRKIFIEVKGVTLENNGVALFPDAPTERGVKHLEELAQSVEEGFEAWVFFVIQMKEIKYFTPNDTMHSEFGTALRHAAGSGVKVIAMDCLITPDSIKIDAPVKVELAL
ncbi:MAG: DNA/RNA nuclease SfsA [Lentisphaeria bacterium]|nr:DNA/RNA nuclease SfsA [Lentisphaeria bacterium]